MASHTKVVVPLRRREREFRANTASTIRIQRDWAREARRALSARCRAKEGKAAARSRNINPACSPGGGGGVEGTRHGIQLVNILGDGPSWHKPTLVGGDMPTRSIPHPIGSDPGDNLDVDILEIERSAPTHTVISGVIGSAAFWEEGEPSGAAGANCDRHAS